MELHPASGPYVLILSGAIAGLVTAAILLVNAAKRAGFLPADQFTQTLAPFAEAFALIFVAILFIAALNRTRFLGLAAFIRNMIALALLTGIEILLNLVFPYLSTATITALRAGPLGGLLVIGSLLFLVASLLLAIAILAARTAPRLTVIPYLLGAIPIALRAYVPETVLDLSVAVLAVAITWLSIWLFTQRAPVLPARDARPGA